MRELNRYLQQRGKHWHYARRIPAHYSDLDTRIYIRKSLNTESIEVARVRRDALIEAEDLYWASLSGRTNEERITGRKAQLAMKRFEAAKRQAMAKGFLYMPMDDLLQSDGHEELVRRLESLERRGGGAPDLLDTQAVLGAVTPPSVTVTQAFKIYCDEIAMSELLGKSKEQINGWRKIKLRAVNNFIKLHGDMSMDKITREHARKFYKWWAKRLVPTRNQRALTANSANRELGNLRKLYREYWEFVGEENRDNPFRRLNFTETGLKDIPHFEDDWVKQQFLNPTIFKGLNSEATLLFYAMIETGCRPSELANLQEENIVLGHDVPHIRIRASTNRQVKSLASIRDIPLVGVSLAAMKNAPQGFPHYRDKGSLLSASLMKAFRTRNLFPTKNHRIYSFRHSFEKRMQEAGLDFALRCLLMGHKNSRPSYGDGGSMEYRRDELLKIAHTVPVKFERLLPEPY